MDQASDRPGRFPRAGCANGRRRNWGFRWETLWQTESMTSWIRDVAGPLNPEQQAVSEGLAAMLERLDPPQLDVTASLAVASANGFHVTLVHRNRPEFTIDLDASGHGEIFVFYGQVEEHFRSQDADEGRVWAFPSADHVQATLSLVEYLLTGRVELRVWKRPLAVKTQSYWINDDSQLELFLRSGTMGPFFGWSRQPEIYRFDFFAGPTSPQWL